MGRREDCKKSVRIIETPDLARTSQSLNETNEPLQLIEDTCKTVKHLNRKLAEMKVDNEMVSKLIHNNKIETDLISKECMAKHNAVKNMHNKHKVKMEKVEEMNRKVDRKLQELTRIANNEPSPFLDYLGLKISIAKEKGS